MAPTRISDFNSQGNEELCNSKPASFAMSGLFYLQPGNDEVNLRQQYLFQNQSKSTCYHLSQHFHLGWALCGL